MTRSPITATLLPLLPLAALGWPLAKVLNRAPYQPTEPELVEAGPLITGYLSVQSAHPFEKIEVKIGQTNWTFGPDGGDQEIQFPREDEITLDIEVTWPEGTPESAVLISLEPNGRLSKEHTLWGKGKVRAEPTFTWDPEP